MNKTKQLPFTTYNGLEDKLASFLSEYGRPYLYLPPDPPVRNSVPRSQRICRFCDQQMPTVKFNSKPHIIPNMLGENYGISDYECDNCNSHFSKFETHFADYLGLVRSLHAVGRKKIPKFKSPAEALIASQMETDSNGEFLTISDENRRNFHFNPEEKSWEIKYTKNTYVPIKIYQILLKIACAVLPKNEAKHYHYLKKFILNDQYIEYFKPFAQVRQCTVAHTTSRPYCIIFDRIHADRSFPLHMAYLCFGNIIYQYFLPFHQLDMHLYDIDKKINLRYTPPLIFGKDKEPGKFSTHFIDFSSSEKKVGEIGYVRFELDEQLFTHAYNTKTNTLEERTLDIDRVTKVYLSKGSKAIDLTELKHNSLRD